MVRRPIILIGCRLEAEQHSQVFPCLGDARRTTFDLLMAPDASLLWVARCHKLPRERRQQPRPAQVKTPGPRVRLGQQTGVTGESSAGALPSLSQRRTRSPLHQYEAIGTSERTTQAGVGVGEERAPAIETVLPLVSMI